MSEFPIAFELLLRAGSYEFSTEYEALGSSLHVTLRPDEEGVCGPPVPVTGADAPVVFASADGYRGRFFSFESTAGEVVFEHITFTNRMQVHNMCVSV